MKEFKQVWLPTYKDTNLKQAIMEKSYHEIVFKCKEYYSLKSSIISPIELRKGLEV